MTHDAEATLKRLNIKTWVEQHAHANGDGLQMFCAGMARSAGLVLLFIGTLVCTMTHLDLQRGVRREDREKDGTTKSRSSGPTQDTTPLHPIRSTSGTSPRSSSSSECEVEFVIVEVCDVNEQSILRIEQ